MTRRQPPPRIWLVTDERQGDKLLPATAKLPQFAGILFRHYSLPPSERHELFGRVAEMARFRDISVLLAGPAELAASWGADGWHGWGGGPGLHSTSVHSLAEIRRAEAEGASLLFLSPVFPTRSHPGSAALGADGFETLARQARLPVIALGGVTPETAPALMQAGAYGWAGVDAWIDYPDQKRTAVPI